MTDKDGKPVCVVQAWQYSYVVGELKVDFDKNGDVSDCQGTPHVLIGSTFKRGATPVSDAEAALIRQDIAASGVLRMTTPDAAAAAKLATYKTEKDALGQKVVALAPANLCLRRVPGSKRDATRSTLGDVCNKDANVIAHGGDVQQLVAQAFLERGKAFFNADISIQNGGGVRIDLPAGNVTVGNIYSVLPFKNTLVQLKMTGAEVKATLEDAIAAVVANNTGSYPYTGGLRWNADLNQPAGSRLSQLEVKTASGYVPLDPAKTYSVVTINFLADGGRLHHDEERDRRAPHRGGPRLRRSLPDLCGRPARHQQAAQQAAGGGLQHAGIHRYALIRDPRGSARTAAACQCRRLAGSGQGLLPDFCLIFA